MTVAQTPTALKRKALTKIGKGFQKNHTSEKDYLRLRRRITARLM
jgi:hypothetical protein